MKSFLVFFFALFFIYATDLSGQNHSPDIVSADALLASYSDYVIIDVSKNDVFKKNSIIGAQRVWRPDFTESQADYGGLMASKNQMEALLSRLGIHPNNKIALYDHRGGCDAARLWWILKYYGHPEVDLLDGGFLAWENRNESLNALDSKHKTSDYHFPITNHKQRYVSLEEVKAALQDTNTIILDARTLDEYEGNKQKDGAYRAGRIPGSIHIDWVSNIDYQGKQNFHTKEELSSLYASRGIRKDKNIICYCQSGVRSANTTFVLTEILGYKNVKNYDGSWIEWSYYKDLPIETGALEEIGIVVKEEISVQYETSKASYGDIFLSSFKNFTNYTWNEITFRVNPWYVNYFWLLIILSLVVWLLEILFPWRKNQPIIRKDFWLDAFFMFFNFYIFKIIIFMAFSNLTAALFHDLIGADVTSLALFDMSAYPIWLQLIIFFVATDFIQWLTHVILHRYTFFWRFHKVHHSVEQMGFAAHLRYHWMENVFYTPMKYIMVMLIGGFTPEMAFIVFYISIAIGHINHANIAWSYGPLKYLINNPKMHIWHHAKELPENRKYGVNFGISLSIWDYIFRKNYIPSNGKDIELGFSNMERYPKGFLGLIFSGFRKTPDED